MRGQSLALLVVLVGNVGPLSGCGGEELLPVLVVSGAGEGEVLSGVAVFRVEIDSPVGGIELAVDGRRVQTCVKLPCLFSLDTRAWRDGGHAVSFSTWLEGAGAIDHELNLLFDNEAPALKILSPPDGASFTEETHSIGVALTASDPAGTAGVRLYLDDALVAFFSACPCSTTLEVDGLIDANARDSRHVLRAESTSVAGHVTTASVGLTVTRRTLWKRDLGAGVVGSIHVRDATVLVTTLDGTLHWLALDGTPLRTFTTDQEIVAGCTVSSSGVVYVGDTGGRAYAVAWDGHALWRTDLGTTAAVVSAPPVLAKNEVYFSLLDGRVMRVAQANGANAALVVGRQAPLRAAVAFDTIGTGSTATYVALVAFADGAVVAQKSTASTSWQSSTGWQPTAPAWEWQAPGGFLSPPVAATTAGTFYLAGTGGLLYALQRTSGTSAQPSYATTVLAAVEGELEVQPLVLASGGVLVATAEGALVRLSSSGEREWWTAPHNAGLGQPLADGAAIFVAGGDGLVAAYGDQATGLSEPRWQVRLPRGIVATPALHQGVLFVGDIAGEAATTGTLYALSTE